MIEYTNEKIAVDVSIYMYKFKGEDKLIENFYIMCNLFRKYNIKPIFIFDGKSPTIKSTEQKIRSNKKKAVKKKYDELQKQYELVKDYKKKEEMKINLQTLKKNCVRIKNEDIRRVKELFKFYSMTYIDAQGEADELCAYLCKKGITIGCLSEDTDMFAYGCSKVLQSFNIHTETAYEFDFTKILSELDVTEKTFRELCVLTGTDYNPSF